MRRVCRDRPGHQPTLPRSGPAARCHVQIGCRRGGPPRPWALCNRGRGRRRAPRACPADPLCDASSEREPRGGPRLAVLAGVAAAQGAGGDRGLGKVCKGGLPPLGVGGSGRSAQRQTHRLARAIFALAPGEQTAAAPRADALAVQHSDWAADHPRLAALGAGSCSQSFLRAGRKQRRHWPDPVSRHAQPRRAAQHQAPRRRAPEADLRLRTHAHRTRGGARHCVRRRGGPQRRVADEVRVCARRQHVVLIPALGRRGALLARCHSDDGLPRPRSRRVGHCRGRAPPDRLAGAAGAGRGRRVGRR
eukprot:m.157257 g.157257  ORF g.157257 m.157257 type:complete len:305 (-) comp23654_c0_seq1:178-1092(-)